MKNMTDTINRYASAWNEMTTEAVTAAFAECCAPDVIYTDENARTYTEKQTTLIEGIDQLTALVMGSHAKVPGRTFSLLTTPQYFDGHCHYSLGAAHTGQKRNGRLGLH